MSARAHILFLIVMLNLSPVASCVRSIYITQNRVKTAAVFSGSFHFNNSVRNLRMGGSSSFKDEFTFDQRLEESRGIVAKYPDRVPVIVEKYSKCDLPELEKKKYLVPRDLSVGHFIHILSSRIRLPSGKALFVFVKNTLPQTGSMMDTVYRSFKDEDGFLYMYYSTEKTFG